MLTKARYPEMPTPPHNTPPLSSSSGSASSDWSMLIRSEDLLPPVQTGDRGLDVKEGVGCCRPEAPGCFDSLHNSNGRANTGGDCSLTPRK